MGHVTSIHDTSISFFCFESTEVNMRRVPKSDICKFWVIFLRSAKRQRTQAYLRYQTPKENAHIHTLTHMQTPNTYTHTHIHTQANIYNTRTQFMYTQTIKYVCRNLRVYIYMFIYIYIYVCIYMYLHACLGGWLEEWVGV